MKMINIVGVFPGQVDYMVSEAKRLQREVGINETMLCMTLHRQGGERLEKVMLHKQIFREYQDKLRALELKLASFSSRFLAIATMRLWSPAGNRLRIFGGYPLFVAVFSARHFVLMFMTSFGSSPKNVLKR